MKMNKNALIIFQKNKVLGQVKTRLAQHVGDEKALQIYSRLIEHTQETVSEVHCSKFVYFSDFIEASTWENTDFKVQVSGDLGLRMYAAIEEVRKLGFKKILVIGTDCFQLKRQDLEIAFLALEKQAYVLGPALDGGYYLIGTKQLNTSVFLNKKWSHQHVLDEAIDEIKRLNLSYSLLDPLNDVDELEDLEGDLIALLNDNTQTKSNPKT